jgi:hypothetical protein
MSTEKRKHTGQDVWNLSREGKEFELVNGTLYPRQPKERLPAHLLSRASIFVGAYVRSHDLGATFAPVGYQLSDHDLLVTSFSFITTDRVPPFDDDPEYDRIAPDLAVDAYTWNNAQIEMQERVDLFFAAGTRQMWVIYPKAQAVYIYTAAKKVEILTGNDVIDGDDVLPGFKLPVKELFNLTEGD